MGEALQIGINRVQTEGDVVHVVDSHAWDQAEMAAMLALIAQVRARHGHVYLLSESKRNPTVSSAARRVFAEWNRDNRFDGVVIYGASVIMRAMLALIFRAAEISSGRKIPVHIVADLTQARQLLAELHAQHQSPAS